ncbi:hypothetical protein YB2330_006499 [Saitoella coloradoensis]
MSVFVSAAQNNSGLQVQLHPLVLLTVSDLYTRCRVQQSTRNAPLPHLVGAVLGTQSGRTLSLETAFQLTLTPDGTLDVPFLVTKADQYKQVFPEYDILGWFTLAAEPGEWELGFQTQFAQATENDSPILLTLDPSTFSPSSSTSGTSDLPIAIYESIIEPPSMVTRFISAPSYAIVSGEAERIAVDHASHPSTTAGGEEASLVQYLKTYASATSLLQQRIRLLKSYLEDVKARKVQPHAGVLREMNALCAQLPMNSSEEDTAFRNEFRRETADVQLTNLLGELTRGAGSVHELVSKHSLASAGAHPRGDAVSQGKKEKGQGGQGGGHRGGRGGRRLRGRRSNEDIGGF